MLLKQAIRDFIVISSGEKVSSEELDVLKDMLQVLGDVEMTERIIDQFVTFSIARALNSRRTPSMERCRAARRFYRWATTSNMLDDSQFPRSLFIAFRN